jgi:hypothetical protein
MEKRNSSCQDSPLPLPIPLLTAKNEIFLGDTKLGLMRECITIYNRPQICIAPTLPTEWAVTLLCIFVGCIAITTTVILLIVSYWERSVITHARWIGFLASKSLTDP